PRLRSPAQTPRASTAGIGRGPHHRRRPETPGKLAQRDLADSRFNLRDRRGPAPLEGAAPAAAVAAESAAGHGPGGGPAGRADRITAAGTVRDGRDGRGHEEPEEVDEPDLAKPGRHQAGRRRPGRVEGT